MNGTCAEREAEKRRRTANAGTKGLRQLELPIERFHRDRKADPTPTGGRSRPPLFITYPLRGPNVTGRGEIGPATG
jgi:hypothetical protein